MRWVCDTGLDLSFVDLCSCVASIFVDISMNGRTEMPLHHRILTRELALLVMCLSNSDGTHGHLFLDARGCLIRASEICNTAFNKRMHVHLDLLAKIRVDLVQILLCELV